MPFIPLYEQAEPRRGFIPLADSSQEQPRRGFIPLAAEPERPSPVKNIALENPATAIAETGMNLASQAVALPVAGLAGLAAEAGRTVGLTEKTGADVVQQVGEALTYQPRGEMGKAATELATYPFQKLAEAGKNLGDKTLDATGSPVAATAVDTAVNALPMLIDPAMRLWLTQPDALRAKAPKAADFLDGFAARHAYGPAMKKAQADMTGWFGQDALNRARSKIGTDQPLTEHFDRFFDKLRQSTVDDLHGVYQMERNMTGGKITPNGAYESARLSRASASIADGAIRYGAPAVNADGSFTYVGKGLEEILRPVAGSLDDTLLYFVGRSARELMLQGREHLFTKAEIKSMLELHTPERLEAFKEYQKWNRGVLDFAEAHGVLNPETRRQWKRLEYLPFHRVQQPGSLKGKPGDWQGIKALTGGTDNIRDVLGNMVANAATLIDIAVKNEARLKIAELASKPGGGRFMVKIDPESRPVKISGNQVMDEMAKRYGFAIDGQPPAFFEFFMNGMPPAGSNVVAVLKDGKKVWYEVGDPILLRSLQAIDRPPMHWLTQWLGMPKRLGQLSITLTPDFMVANIARDTIMGAVMSRSGFRPVLDSINGMRLRITNDPVMKDYVATPLVTSGARYPRR